MPTIFVVLIVVIIAILLILAVGYLIYLKVHKRSIDEDDCPIGNGKNLSIYLKEKRRAEKKQALKKKRELEKLDRIESKKNKKK